MKVDSSKAMNLVKKRQIHVEDLSVSGVLSDIAPQIQSIVDEWASEALHSMQV